MAGQKPGASGNGRTTPNALAMREKERKALELRKAGATYDDIAKALEYKDRGGASKAVYRALARTIQEPADDLRKLEAERLDKMMLTAWQIATGPKVAVDSRLRAIDRVYRGIELRSKLFGLGAAGDGEALEHAASAIGQIGAALRAAAILVDDAPASGFGDDAGSGDDGD